MEAITIPHPDNAGHTDNLCTIPLLEAQGFEGPDTSLAISLFEYDLIWRRITPDEGAEQGDDTLFVYRIRGDKDPEKYFDRVSMKSSLDFEKEFNWIKDSGWESFFNSTEYTEETWAEEKFEHKIYALVHHYGYENIFGSSHWEGFKVRDPEHDYGSDPAPGEGPEEYQSRLLFGDDDSEAVIVPEFKRDEDEVWFVSGGSQCFGCQLHQWHSGMDAVYAAGSLVAAKKGVPLEVLQDAIDLLKHSGTQALGREEPYAAAHADALVQVMEAALKAEPSDEVQYLEG